MPANPQSLRLTDLYRTRLEGIRARVDQQSAAAWQRVSTDDLDGTYGLWLGTVVPSITLAQALSVRATAGYLGAYLTSELGRRVQPPSLDPKKYAGKSRDGRSLEASLLSPLIGAKAAIGDGLDPSEALSRGFSRAERGVGLDADQAARLALSEALQSDDRFVGWRRAVKGTCGACVGSVTSERVSVATPLHIHPNCKCVAEPVVGGVSDSSPRPTGTEIFRNLSQSEQDEQFGPDKAQLLRSGAITVASLVATSPLETEPDFITERPLSDLVVTSTA